MAVVAGRVGWLAVQVLYEDAASNRMNESLDVFGELGQAPALRQVLFILLLNKKVSCLIWQQSLT